jgi:sugar phosphate isomerase/epimerase
MLKLATKFAPHLAAFEMAREAGFHHAELWTDAEVLANWKNVAAWAFSQPLEYVLHFPNRKDLSDETLAHAVALYRELGCRAMVIHQPLYDKYAQALDRLWPDICLAVENHKLDHAGLTDWAERNAELTLDVEHVWKYTLDDAPLERLLDEIRGLLTRYGHKLRHIHLPGYLPGYDEHRPMYCSREMIFPVLSLLAEIEFTGFVVSEIELAYQTANDLRMDVLMFDTWRRQAVGEDT